MLCIAKCSKQCIYQRTGFNCVVLVIAFVEPKLELLQIPLLTYKQQIFFAHVHSNYAQGKFLRLSDHP